MTESQYQMMVRLAERNRALIGLNPDEIKPAADPIIAEIRSQIQKYDRSGNRDAWILKAAQYAATQPDFWKTVNGVDIPRLNVHQAVVAWIDSGFDPERRPSAARARDLVKQVIYHSKKGRLPGKGGLRPYCRRVE